MVLVDGVFEHVEHGHLDGFALDVVFLDIAVGAFQHKVGGRGDIAAIGVVVFEVVGGINPYGVVGVTVVVEQDVGHGEKAGVESDTRVCHGVVVGREAVEIADDVDGVV